MSFDDAHDPSSVYSAILSVELLNELFDDIAACGRDVHARLKSREAGLASESRVSLADAKEALEAGIAAQVRYEYQGKQWSDTFQRTPQGMRLIRAALPEI